MLIELNALETARFGVVAARASDPCAAPEAMNAEARVLGVQLLTIRVDSADHAQIHALENDGHRLMDCLVYYECALTDFPRAPGLPEGVVIRQAEQQDADRVAEVAHAAFSNYMDHYHSDPRLDNEAATAAYEEWARLSIANVTESQPAFVAIADGLLVGFLTLRRNDPGEIEIVLNAVAPKAQRRGLYRLLLVRALAEEANMGAVRMITSTQINNFSVQRTWATIGLRPYRSILTFHKWFD